MKNKINKICFVALGAHPLLVKSNEKFIGGPSIQQVLLAQGLIKKNFQICFITYSDEDGKNRKSDYIDIFKVYKREEINNINLFKKIYLLWKALKKTNADIFFHRSGASGIVSLYCLINRKKFIRFISSDAEVDGKKYINLLDRIGIWLDITFGDKIIVQNEIQRENVKNKFGKDSIIIRNGFTIPKKNIIIKSYPPIILWVSSIRRIKNPELFLKLAKAIPKVKFMMIGGVGDNDYSYYDLIKEKSKKIKNLDFLGFIKFDRIEKYFNRASIFINTSEYEGFPNTFVQAWMYKVPVVSLKSNPDSLITENKMGLISGTFNQMIEDVKLLVEDVKYQKQMGNNAREYVIKKHDFNKILYDYIKIFEQFEKN